MIDAFPASVLPAGVRSRFVENINGLRVHMLEAGFETPGRPLVVLLHGFPEIAWSWRKVIGPLAAAGASESPARSGGPAAASVPRPGRQCGRP